jgi:hypothetical protein
MDYPQMTPFRNQSVFDYFDIAEKGSFPGRTTTSITIETSDRRLSLQVFENIVAD